MPPSECRLVTNKEESGFGKASDRAMSTGDLNGRQCFQGGMTQRPLLGCQSPLSAL